MTLAAVQTRPVRRDPEANLSHHLRLAREAIERGAELILFPELSLTGYEPADAARLARPVDEWRMPALQRLADESKASIAVGVPVARHGGVTISLMLLQSARAPVVYAKRHLHADELPFFIPGSGPLLLAGPAGDVALAICYEISVPEHAAETVSRGARVYAASVAKTERGIESAHATLSETAKRHGVWTMVANCVGPSGDGLCGGRSAAWRPDGTQHGALGPDGEGVLVVEVPS